MPPLWIPTQFLFKISLIPYILARLHVKIHGITGLIAKHSTSNQIAFTTIDVHVGLREKQTKSYTVASEWDNESFSFDLTFHEHLFWNLQVM